MNDFIDSFAYWLADFYLLSTILLAATLAAMWCLKQPVKRLAVAKSVLVATALLAVLCALPGWSAIHLLAGRASVPPMVQSPTVSNTPSIDAAVPIPPTVANEHRSAPPLSLPELPHDANSVSLTALFGLAHWAGSACVLAWLGLGALAARQLLRDSRPAPSELSRVFAQIASADGHRIDILVSDRIDVAVAIGVKRPCVVLPNRWVDNRSAEELQTVLAHEVAHVENGDLAWLALGRLLLVLLWAQPLYWLLRRTLRLDQEVLADAAAAEHAGRRQYAEQLVAWARDVAARPRLLLPSAMGLWEGPSQLRRRVTMLLDERLTMLRQCPRRWQLAASLAPVAMALSLSLASLQPPSEAADEAPTAKVNELSTDDGASESSRELMGEVVDKKTGAAIPQTKLNLRIIDATKLQPWKTLEESDLLTDDDGRFKFTMPSNLLGNPLIYLRLELTHPDYAPYTIQTTAKGVAEQAEGFAGQSPFTRIELERGEVVSGVVEKPDGSPAANVRIVAFSEKVSDSQTDYAEFGEFQTNEDGRFQFAVAPGSSAVFWLLPKEFAAQTHDIDRRRGDLGALRLEEGVRLGGRVVDRQGAPVSNVWVNTKLIEGPAKKKLISELSAADQIERSALTDSDGRFNLAPLPPSTYRVIPDEYREEGDQIFETLHPLPAAFLPFRVKLFSSQSAPSIELRAVESSTVSAQFVDREGQPTRGYAFFLNGTTPEGQRYSIRRTPDQSGKVTFLAPKDLTNAIIDLPLSSIRQRKVAGASLSKNTSIYLGNLDRDWRDIQITKYQVPVLLIDIAGPDGKRLSLVKVAGEYTSVEQEDNSYVVPKQEIDFEQQADGKWRSDHDLVPDEEFRVTIAAEGFQPFVETMSLKEGVSKELAVTLNEVAETGKSED